jgi:hypothetical protein
MRNKASTLQTFPVCREIVCDERDLYNYHFVDDSDV